MTAQGNLGRLALVICLLTICIETLERSHHQVINQIYTGMNLFEEWMSSASENPQNLLGLSSPKHYLVEAEIIQEFQNFSAEASALFDPRPRGYHQKLQCEGFEALQSMPHILTNTQEARLYLDLITRRTHHFITSIRPDKTGYTNQQHDSSTPGLNTGFDTLQLFTELPEHLQLEQEIYAHEIHRWSASFTPLTSDRDLLTPNSSSSAPTSSKSSYTATSALAK